MIQRDQVLTSSRHRPSQAFHALGVRKLPLAEPTSDISPKPGFNRRPGLLIYKTFITVLNPPYHITITALDLKSILALDLLIALVSGNLPSTQRVLRTTNLAFPYVPERSYPHPEYGHTRSANHPAGQLHLAAVGLSPKLLGLLFKHPHHFCSLLRPVVSLLPRLHGPFPCIQCFPGFLPARSRQSISKTTASLPHPLQLSSILDRTNDSDQDDCTNDDWRR
jgi:hypothetical protein